MYKIHYFQRKRRDGKNYSLEQIFEDLRKRLINHFEVNLIEMPFISSGLFKRAINIIYSFLRQGDVNHVTGDINYINLLQSKHKNILTILDCGILHRKNGISKKLIQWIWFKIPVKRSRFVTVISNSTKQDLLAHVNCNPEKIRVIYVPISENFNYTPKEYNHQNPKILQIGSASNKNLSRLIHATREIQCKLIIIGEISHSNQEILEKYNTDYENYIGISFKEVINQYRICDLLFFASTFEGFGMPILEAQATGRPVITSNILSMPEVGGDAAHYVDPFNVDDIRKGIEKVNSDSHYREQLIIKGIENVKRFDPEVIANQYDELYNEICKKI